MPPKSEIAVIGNPWMASVMGYALLTAGHRPSLYFLDEASPHPAPQELPIHVGNGEVFENARLTFGKEIAEALWEISSQNYKKSKAWFARLGVSFTEGRTLWFASGEKQKVLIEATARHNPVASLLKGPEWLRQGTRKFDSVSSEAGLRFHTQHLSQALHNKFVEQELVVKSIDKFLGVEKLPSLDYRFSWEVHGQKLSATAAVVILLSDRIPVSLFPSLAGKWIPVTLSSFTFKNKTHKEFIQSFFNGGADFAFRGNGGMRLGSFRNLFEDKAVGIHHETDEATLKGVTDFFAGLDWIASDSSPQHHLSAESISCDGLPLVGPLSDLPGVHLLGGFQGRTQNFLFEVSELLARAIVKGENTDRLNLFSLKRFA